MPPTKTASVSPGVTANVAVAEPPCPPVAAPAPPSAPSAVTVTFVAPAGTTKLCDAPVYPSVTVPVHLPGPHEHIPPVGQVIAQLAQTPLLPHAIVLVPATHVPFVAAEQQPPLHACVEEQLVVHACVVVLHACPTGQSLVALQPQVPAETHALPPPSTTHATGPPQMPTPVQVSTPPSAHRFCPVVHPVASDVLPSSPPIVASPPPEEPLPSSEPPSPARIGSPMPAIAAHPAEVSASASTVGASRMPVIARLPSA
jgi:hypothetical protein